MINMKAFFWGGPGIVAKTSPVTQPGLGSTLSERVEMGSARVDTQRIRAVRLSSTGPSGAQTPSQDLWCNARYRAGRVCHCTTHEREGSK